MRQRTSNMLIIWLGAIVVVLGMAAIGGFALLTTLRGPTPANIPMVAILPSATLPSKVLPPTSQPTATPITRPTLPPTWTITPTTQASPTPLTTATPIRPPTNVAATAAILPTYTVQQLANTYWEGDGSGSMWDFQFEDGSFGRFAVQPVNVWVGTNGNLTLTDAHQRGIQNALDQISQIVPVQRVENRVFAHMTVWLMDDTEFAQNAACGEDHTSLGCTAVTFTNAGIMLNTIWVRAAEEHFDALLLHELTHGLGIVVHSPNPEDIMYAYDQGQPARYTARDLNTLRTLYNAPAYNPRNN